MGDTDTAEETMQVTAEQGTVVFLKNETESDSANDIWDDTALIKAYDKAIQQAQQGDVDLKPPKSKKKNKGKKKAEKSPKSWKWSVGNQCQAVYSEDGIIYDAVITEMLGNGECVVQYTDYGNEEQQYLKDLLKSSSKPSRQYERAESLRAQSPARSTSCSECSASSQNPTRHFPSSRSPRHLHERATPHHMPSFVPPPPPSIPGLSACDTDEAFHSMLISWYMSGFHTGYYQGLKDGRDSAQH